MIKVTPFFNPRHYLVEDRQEKDGAVASSILVLETPQGYRCMHCSSEDCQHVRPVIRYEVGRATAATR